MCNNERGYQQMKREQLGSRMGFIMLSAGCAIGCGNVWKFPWLCGQNGGGSFMLVYILCLILLGIPALVMEFSIGRAAQTSPLYMYQKLEKPGQKWGIFGWICFIGNLSLMAFYTVVCGWIIYYFCKFLTGQNSSLGFVSMISNPVINVSFLLVGNHGCGCIYYSFLQPAGRSGTSIQIYDVCTAGSDACTCHPQSFSVWSWQRHDFLSQTGLFQN